MNELIKLTILASKMKDDVQKRLQDKISKSKEKEEDGFDADFYERLGINPPKYDDDDEEDEDMDEDGFITLGYNEDDYEVLEREGVINVSSIVLISETDGGSNIYFPHDLVIKVKESVSQIYKKIEKLNK